MNELTETSVSSGIVAGNDHSRDGDDPDRHTRRMGGKDWEWCRQAAEDFRELEAMTESDKRHYCATPGGSGGNSISRGR